MTTYNPNDFYPRTGQEIKSDGTTVNEADGINPDGSQNVQLVGKNALLQTQKFPSYIVSQTVAAGASYNGSTINLDGYQNIIAGFSGASSGSTQLNLIDTSNNNPPLNATILGTTSAGSANSNPVAIVCSSGCVQIKNASATPQTFNVSVYVR